MTVAKTTTNKEPRAAGRYAGGVGRRKTAIARVRLTKGKGAVSVNERPINQYFFLARYRDVAVAPLTQMKLDSQYDVTVHVRGGGVAAQAEAVRHGIARALLVTNPEFRKRLRNLGFLTRDPRMVERKKYGLKKARRAPQWSKR